MSRFSSTRHFLGTYRGHCTTETQLAPVMLACSDVAALEAEQVFKLHARYVAAIAIRLMGRSDEIDDVVQDVFVETLRGLRTVREPHAIRSWLATVTTRLVRRRLRLRKLRQFFGLEHSAVDEIAAPGASPEDRLLLQRLYLVLDKLPVDHRLAWALRYLEGEALELVAQRCECSLATVKRRIAAAQAAIEEELNRG